MQEKPFNPFIASIWRRLAETMLVEPERMAISSQQVVDNLQAMFGNIRGTTPFNTGISVLAAWVVLGGPVWHFAPRSFRVWRVQRRLQKTRVDLFQDMARIRGIVYAGYYGHWQAAEGPNPDQVAEENANRDNPVLGAIGYKLPHHRDRAGNPDDPAIAEFTGNDLPASAFVHPDAIPDEVEVVVIGSGAGGAVAAANLAAQGYEVLVIEAGPYLSSTQITTHEKWMSSSLFKDGAIQTTRDRDIIVFQGRTVGGSTVINNGICLRLEAEGETHPDANDVLATWAGLGAPIAEDALEQAYSRVEAVLGVHEIDRRLGRNNGTRLLAGWDAYQAGSSEPLDQRAISGWFRKNWGAKTEPNACISCGYCNTGCPYGRKRAMPESFLGRAVKADRPARILAEAEVAEIGWGPRDAQGRRVANAVKLVLPDHRGKTVRVTKGVVVAAGTIASSNILSASGIRGTGKDISLNIACPVPALMPDDVIAWDEDQMATFIDRGDFLIESHFQPPMSMSSLVPGWFDEHFRRMQHYNRLASAGVLFPADRRGTIKKGKLDFKLQEADLAVLRRALALLAKVHFAGGALEVYPALLHGDTLHAGMSDAEIDALLAARIREPDDVVLSSSHPHGGNAINADPAKGVVDLDQRVHGTANVLVCDASVMPSCIRVNAQLTTMAMADRVTFGRPVFG
ncbi:MAG: GMC family oxidoreductase N-terminal domain-containing protein [Erythrobacter sp.]|uniref:GMC family oxidoreductase N-terminal domain-containing protein n=1 Tax=Erythrobacter sp. TaxID=1042 RepID=UPI0025D4EED6|nr:GMC family oxidoreductase N-terminal domain-containing protein [Erythrobacter sp.]MCL9998161.1 GMC family oxidoreductase N-terminal domain-containing protein [Erythrobacter sp.]